MSKCKSILSVILSVCLVFVPFAHFNVYADPVISSFVIGLFLTVAIALGFHFDISIADISAWAEAKIQAYLTANGYGSVAAWLGANFESEVTVSGSFLGLTPNLWAKLKLAVEASIGSGDDDLPQGGSVSSPVTRSLLSNFYLPCDITITGVGTFSGNYPIINWEAISGRTYDWTVYNTNCRGYTFAYNQFPLSFPTSLNQGTAWVPFQVVSNNITYNFNYYINHTYTVNSNLNGYLSVSNSTSNNSSSSFMVKVPISGASDRGRYADANYNIQLAFIPREGNYSRLIPCLIYKAIDGYTYLMYQSSSSIAGIPAFQNGNGSITAFGVGIPQYNFNNADLIYIDLQIGNLTSALSALIDLITAINNNLITWTVALQSNNPADLPEDTTSLIDYVDYCNEQTNLYLSGTSSLASCLGNMYSELYNDLNTVSSSQISNALINTYNAFINKLTLYASSSDSGGSLTSVQNYQYSLTQLTGTDNQKITQATSLLNTYVSNASGLSEVIALYNAYTSYCEDLGFQINLVTDTKTVVTSLNTIVDNYLSGSIDQNTALTSLLTTYKSGLNSAKTADQVCAIVQAYQVCVDRISLYDLEVDPDGLGQTADDVIQMEDDLISHIDLDSLSAMLDFQNWTYINSSEGSLYREFFQKIMDSNSPFYLFIYVPMILGIVSIVLGTRVTLPHKVKASHDDSVRIDPKYDRYNSDYSGKGT